MDELVLTSGHVVAGGLQALAIVGRVPSRISEERGNHRSGVRIDSYGHRAATLSRTLVDIWQVLDTRYEIKNHRNLESRAQFEREKGASGARPRARPNINHSISIAAPPAGNPRP